MNSAQQDYAKYKSIIDMHVNKYRGTDVPEEVIRSKAKVILADTIKNYDPSKGEITSLLHSNLQGLSRFVGDSMQIRMPEYKRQKLTKVMDAIYDQYGDDSDEPIDFKHMSKILNMRPKTIQSIYTQANRGIVTDPSVEAYVGTPGVHKQPDYDSLYKHLPTQKHKDVFDYTMGTGGKKPIKTNKAIAETMGMSESYVRKLKSQILDLNKMYGDK